jgi:subtilisin family serine protease
MAALATVSTQTAAAQPEKLAPIHRAAEPIKDALGRTEVIIDFNFDPSTDTEFDGTLTTPEELKWKSHQPKTVKFLNRYESRYGLTMSGMNSWTKSSLVGFVTQDQLEKLAKDKRVTLITENEYHEHSGFFTASDSITTGESSSWGWSLTTSNTTLNAGSSERRIYLIDSGVALHDDLNVVRRVNVACGTGVENCSTSTSTDAYPVVGCYPHATHVAGIAGALSGNSKTARGVYPGVKIVSIAVGNATGTNSANAGKCSTGVTTAAIGFAFDWIYKTLRIRTYHGDSRVPIINMSINPARLGFDGTGTAETNRAALLSLVNPAAQGGCVSRNWESKECGFNYPYQGGFFVQSAGNIGAGASATNSPTFNGVGKNICTERWDAPSPTQQNSFAYTPSFNAPSASVSDGIMVVGGFHPNGRAASNLPNSLGTNGTDQFQGEKNSSGTFERATDRFSNYGPCVDIWAPGNLIYSTFGNQVATGANVFSQVGVTYSGNGNLGNSGWVYLSGTSMAAPHVAGAAAYLADSLNLSSPSAIETAVRARMHSTGNSDQISTPIKFVQLP